MYICFISYCIMKHDLKGAYNGTPQATGVINRSTKWLLGPAVIYFASYHSSDFISSGDFCLFTRDRSVWKCCQSNLFTHWYDIILLIFYCIGKLCPETFQKVAKLKDKVFGDRLQFTAFQIACLRLV